MLKIPYLVSGKAGVPALNADIFQPNCRRQKSRNRKEILVQLREVVVGGGRETEKQTTLSSTPPPAAHSLPFSRFLRTSFFSSIKEVQKGKLNSPNYRIEKKPISM